MPHWHSMKNSWASDQARKEFNDALQKIDGESGLLGSLGCSRADQSTHSVASNCKIARTRRSDHSLTLERRHGISPHA